MQALLQDIGHEGPEMVSLTTRLPCFSTFFDFQPYSQQADGSIAMLILLPDPAVFKSLTQ